MSSGEATVPSLTSRRARPEHSAPHGGVFLSNIATLEGVNTEELVKDWAPLPDIAELTGLGISQVRRLLEDGAICGIKIGDPKVLRVPLAFFVDGEVVKPLKGTLHTLYDAGFDYEEAIVWLFTHDESLPGRPIDLLRAGNKKEVRRRAQALAF